MASIDYPENDFTRMIEMTKSENRSGIRRNVGVASATPMPTVQSASVGRPVEEPEPLTLEERDALDKAAIAAGVKDPRLGNQNPDGTLIDLPGAQSQYGTLEEAIAAGAPVGQDASVVDSVTEYTMLNPDRVTAREFLGSRGDGRAVRRAAMAAIGAPRIPDFTKIEGIDLMSNRVIMDGLDFPISDEQAVEFKEFVMGIVRDAILAKLDAAATLFAKRLFQPAPAEATDGGAGPEDTGTKVQQQ